MGDDLRRYRSMIRKMRERVFLKHPEKLDVFDEQYERERLRAQEEFPGAPDVGQYWAERRTWDWAWGTNYPFPGGLVPPMRPSHIPANAGPAGVVNQVPKGPGDSNGASSSASKADHKSSVAEADASIAQSASSKKPSTNASKAADAQTASAKKQPSANTLKAADKPSQAVRGMSLGDPEGSSRNPPTQQRRIAIPRPRLPTIEAAAAQDRLRAELAGLQRTLEQLQPPVNPNEREERAVAAMAGSTMGNPA